MNPHYKYWDSCQRCPKHICKHRQSENGLVDSLQFTGRHTWQVQAPCNYTSLFECHDKNVILYFNLRIFNIDSIDQLTFLYIKDAFDYLLTNAKELEEAISLTKIMKQLRL